MRKFETTWRHTFKLEYFGTLTLDQDQYFTRSGLDLRKLLHTIQYFRFHETQDRGYFHP